MSTFTDKASFPGPLLYHYTQDVYCASPSSFLSLIARFTGEGRKGGKLGMKLHIVPSASLSLPGGLIHGKGDLNMGHCLHSLYGN